MNLKLLNQELRRMGYRAVISIDDFRVLCSENGVSLPKLPEYKDIMRALEEL